MTTAAMVVAGALAWLKRDQDGFTETNIDDVLMIGILVDILFLLVGIILTVTPVIGDLQSFFPTINLTLQTSTIYLLGGQLIYGYIHFLIGALLVPAIDAIGEIL